MMDSVVQNWAGDSLDNWSGNIGVSNWSDVGLNSWSQDWGNNMFLAMYNGLALVRNCTWDALYDSSNLSDNRLMNLHVLLMDNWSSSIYYRGLDMAQISWTSSSNGEKSRQHHL